MNFTEQDAPALIELPVQSNFGVNVLCRIAFRDWSIVYLEGHIRHTLVHDIPTNKILVTTVFRGKREIRVVDTVPAAIQTIVECVTAR